jgi:hypothetical protein
MIRDRTYENRTRDGVAGMYRRPGSLQALRRRHETDSLRFTLHARAPRTRVQKEITRESEPARPQAKD